MTQNCIIIIDLKIMQNYMLTLMSFYIHFKEFSITHFCLQFLFHLHDRYHDSNFISCSFQYSLELCYLLVQSVVVFNLRLFVHPDLHSENLFLAQSTIFSVAISSAELGFPVLLISILALMHINVYLIERYFTSHSSLMRFSWTVKDSDGASRHKHSSHRNRADIILTLTEG